MSDTQPPPPHARAVADVAADWGIDVSAGLSEDQVESRRAEHGLNRLRAARQRAWWRVLGDQFRSIVVLLLCAAAVAAFVTARWPEGFAVTAVIIVNTLIGFLTEWKARRSMQALRRRSEHAAHVRRDGEAAQVPASAIVPGDVLLLSPGETVAADARLCDADQLRIDESPLTGESVPVDKTTDAVEADAPLAERGSMVFKGTTVADGSGAAIVTGTGADTELGRIAEMAETAEAEQTPLQQRLNALGGRLAWITIGVAVVIAAAGWWAGQPTLLMIETAIALAVAAIPEGLPIVATIALARGMYRMAKRNALVNRLTAVETLGATRVIFTDKTGTLTENRMTAARLTTPAGDHDLTDDADDPPAFARHLLELGALCNNASLPDDTDAENQDDEDQDEADGPRGDPEEQALLRAADEAGIDVRAFQEKNRRVREQAFEHETMKMATFHETDDGVRVAVKGAPEAVLEACDRLASDEGNGEAAPLRDADRETWRERSDELAGEGLRVLAVAEKWVDDADAEPYEGLIFVGLIGFIDPPREDVKNAIDTCQAAGIRVAMVTGDTAETAEAVAESVGIVGDPEDPEAAVMTGSELGELDDGDEDHRRQIHRTNIFSRVEPAQKLDLVRLYQDTGEVVAMTGDGINDAPALKKADIGVAMGKRGTEAAKQVADMVLRDDRLGTIVDAVEQGRVIFGNIRKSVMFMLCTNVAEVLAVAIASMAGWTLPLRPLQILYLNVITDVLPALALGVGPGVAGIMKDPPRDPGEAVLTRRHWSEILAASIVIAICVLSGMLLAQRWLGMDPLAAVTVAFLTLAFAKVWFTFALRDPRSGLFVNEITTNRWVWLAVAACIALLLAAVYLPGLNALLETRRPTTTGWLLIAALSLIPLLVGQIARAVQKSQ